MEHKLEKQNGRLFYLDFLRAIATVAVIAMHISIDNSGGTFVDLLETVRYMLASWCVPLFLMITGTLFLNANSCTFERIWKHVKKTILIIVFWGFIYNFICLFLIEGFSVSTVVNSLKMIVLADTTYCYQFWYLYALIPMYFLLPVFNAFVKNASNKDFTIIVALFFAFSIIAPTVLKYTGDFGAEALLNKFSLFCSLFFYMLLGAYLNRLDVKKSVGCVLLVVSVLIFGIAVVCGVFSISIGPERLYGYDAPYTCIVASAIFILAQAKNTFSEISQKVFGAISKYSLGIYILHVIIIQMLRKIVHLDASFAPAYVSLPILVAVVFIISFVGSMVAKKIPIIKKLL